MIYRRPANFDQVEQYMRALTTAKVSGRQEKLRNAIERLIDMQWPTLALKPLYEANAVVKLVSNSLVPMLQEHVLEAHVMNDLEKNTIPEKRARRVQEYEELRSKLKSACIKARERSVTEEFAQMRDSMMAYNEDEVVQQSLAFLFEVSKAGRIALRLMSERITSSLEKDSEIVRSTDIPMSALSL